MDIKETFALKKVLFSLCRPSKTKTPAGPDPLRGLLHEKGYIIATDSHDLAMLRAQYDPVYEGQIVERNGDFIDGAYVPYAKAIPPEEERLETPVAWINDLRRLSGSLKDEKWIFVGNDCYLRIGGLRRIFKLFDAIRQTPTMYLNKYRNSAVMFQSEDCLCLTMPLELRSSNLAAAQDYTNTYDYDLLGIQ